MTDPSPSRHVGYCTNVHAGATLEQMLANLRQHVPAIRHHLQDPAPLPIGLWLSRTSLEDVRRTGLSSLRDTLAELETIPFTMNGFPYGDFHQSRVKHAVYSPGWDDPRRLTYTLDLAAVMTELHPAGVTRGISTLPVAWGNAPTTAVEAAGSALRTLARELSRLEAETGTCIHVDLEPEPGCVLQTSADVVTFFEDHLLGSGDADLVRRHLRICHDTCHAAVMFESQTEVVRRYDAAGLSIGKVQVSSAPAVHGPMSAIRRAALEAFNEPRWLHQTCRRRRGRTIFFEDLPEALARTDGEPDDELRVHFHVPVHLATLGELGTTQRDLREAIRLLADRPDLTDWEVETYAWSALPPDLFDGTLAEGIARELRWTREALETVR